jgi:FAD/FMN-containing dehydrogenase
MRANNQGGEMAAADLDRGALQTLRAGFDGRVLRPDDAGYDEARKVYNGMIDKRPAVITTCASTDDVAAAVNFARENDLIVAVRSGGHSVGGMSIADDGLLIDLSELKSIDIDPESRTARAGAGLLWGEYDKATQEHGLHTPAGRVTTTGVGGFTTGGGYGWTSSVHGLTCDNLISAEVVTADGRVVTASEDENEDLFWGIRGGGCNFGVVTSFEYRLHELGPTVLGGLMAWPVAEAPRVLRAWRDYVEGAPDELSSACAILTGPPEEFVPEHLQGQPILGMVGMYVGDPDEGTSVVQPLKDLGPDLDLIGPMPYTEFQAILDPGNQPGFRNYWRGEYLTGLPDEAIDTFVEHGKEPLSPFNQIVFFRLGGGLSKLDDEATAFSHRDAEYMFHPIAMWEDAADDERQIGFVRKFSEAMRPFATGAAYLNFTPEANKVREAYGEEKWARLVELKDRYDPENLFQHNQNIEPSRKAAVPA